MSSTLKRNMLSKDTIKVNESDTFHIYIYVKKIKYLFLFSVLLFFNEGSTF